MIVVLGGGPAGRTAAIHLALNGEDVTLVERGELGGQCLHHGCMMVCALNDAARARGSVRNLRDLGIFTTVPDINFPRLLEQMRTIQAKIAGILDEETRGAGVNIIYGKEGRVAGRSVTVNGEDFPADSVIIATGSRPNVLDVPGITLPGVFSPQTLVRMPSIPREIVIIGGGIMAAEFAYIFQEFGAAVHLVSRSGFLKALDPKLASHARKELGETQVYEHFGVEAVEGRERAEGVRVSGRDGTSTIPCDTVFISAGLTPRSETIDGIRKGPNGEIVVDRQMRTSVREVFACGDVTGSPLLTPVARHEGLVAAENILGREVFMDYTRIPQSMSLFNEYAFVTADHPCAIAVSVPGPAGPGTFWSVPSGMTGFAKVGVDPDTGKLCGIHVAAPSAGIIAAYYAFLMQQDIGVKEFDNFIEVHPMADGVYPLMKFVAGKLRDGTFP
jgi:dihydrolipoamide dehydrogenase